MCLKTCCTLELHTRVNQPMNEAPLTLYTGGGGRGLKMQQHGVAVRSFTQHGSSSLCSSLTWNWSMAFRGSVQLVRVSFRSSPLDIPSSGSPANIFVSVQSSMDQIVFGEKILSSAWICSRIYNRFLHNTPTHYAFRCHSKLPVVQLGETVRQKQRLKNSSPSEGKQSPLLTHRCFNGMLQPHGALPSLTVLTFFDQSIVILANGKLWFKIGCRTVRWILYRSLSFLYSGSTKTCSMTCFWMADVSVL